MTSCLALAAAFGFGSPRPTSAAHPTTTTTTTTTAAPTTTLAQAASQACTHNIGFEDAAPGSVVTAARTDSGAGPIGVYGHNPELGGRNAALLFDSTCTGGCSGGDSDLGAPNVDFGGPGLGTGGGAGGVAPNMGALGNVLVVADDLDDLDGDAIVDDPGDQAGLDTRLELDFSAFGRVAIESITIIDVEVGETAATLELADAAGAVLAKFVLPRTGNNGVARATFAPVNGVVSATLSLHGSAAIDNVRFSAACDDGDPCTIDLCEEGRGCAHDPVPGCATTTTTTVTLAASTTTVERTASTMTRPTTTTSPAVAPATTVPQRTPDLCGDANGNGRLTAGDAAQVLAAAVSLTVSCSSVCDADGDRRIGAADALRVLRASVGLPAELLCP